jgi:C-terminal processing protease CtpA/Prc
MVSQMSEQSRSVANDLLRLEAQLSMVGKSRGTAPGVGGSSNGSVSGSAPSASTVVSRTESSKRRDDCGMTVTSNYTSNIGKSSSSRSGGGREHISASARRAAARTLLSRATVVAPPGKLGIILANRTDLRGTVVSGVRTSSILAEQVSPGDRIVAIDGEDVSQMNVKEITTIMARKSEFERVLVLLATPKVQYD